METSSTHNKIHVPRFIPQRLALLRKKAQLICDEITALQKECPHIKLTKKYGANTGNYDPSADSYWIDWHCTDCDSKWTTDQKSDRLYPHAIDITHNP
jgi:hypothetical protein